MVILAYDSGNENCHRGILAANWNSNPHVHFCSVRFRAWQIIITTPNRDALGYKSVGEEYCTSPEHFWLFNFQFSSKLLTTSVKLSRLLRSDFCNYCGRVDRSPGMSRSLVRRYFTGFCLQKET